MEKVSCRFCNTTGCFVKKYCSNDWISKIDNRKYQIPYKQNQNIITEISPVLGIYFIRSGKVKVLSTGINGKKQIVRLAKEGHLVGHRGIKNDTYPISAVAMVDSSTCFFENNTLNEMFHDNSDFTVALMMYYSRELRKLENRLKNLAQMNIREKIAEALLLINDTFGINGKREMEIDISRDDIANIAGTNVEQVSRQISEFEAEKILARKGKKIILLRNDQLKTIIKNHNQAVIADNPSEQ